MRWWLLVLTACGRLEFDELVTQDAPVSAVDPRAPWGPPELVPVVPGGADDDPTLRFDLLELVFERDQDLVVMTRSAPDAAWSTPSVLPLSSPAEDTTPELSPDGRTLYFASTRAGGAGGRDLYLARRVTLDAPWGPAERIVELATGASEYSACELADGRTLVLTRDVGEPDLFTSSRADPGAPWEAPQALPELNSSSDDSSSWLSADGLVIYFQSNRNVGFDLYVATRTSVDVPFDTPTRIDSISQPGTDEEDPWVSPDGRQLYFVSDRSGSDRLYRATR